jgi:uncharacterized protein (DUF2062 family)
MNGYLGKIQAPENKKLYSKNKRNTVLHKAYERFIKIRGHPREIALGFALGIFIGMTPTMGVQTPLAVFLAALFKWSKLSAGFGV